MGYLKEIEHKQESPKCEDFAEGDGLKNLQDALPSPRRRENSQMADYQPYDLKNQRRLQPHQVVKTVPEISAFNPRSFPQVQQRS